MSMYKLLIVDDELLIREGLAKNIDWESMGFTVLCTAASGEEAYAFTAMYHPDVLITDISMANMDGIALMKKLRDNGFTLPIVILSGYDDFTYAQQAIKYNAVEYLLKPVNQIELHRVFQDIRAKLDVSGTKPQTDVHAALDADTKKALQISAMMMYLEGQAPSPDLLSSLPVPSSDAACSIAVLSSEPTLLQTLTQAVLHHNWSCEVLTIHRYNTLIILYFGDHSNVEIALSAFLHRQHTFIGNTPVYCLLEGGTFDVLPYLYRNIMAAPQRFFYTIPWQVSSLRHATCTTSALSLPTAQTLLNKLGSSRDEWNLSLDELLEQLRLHRPNPNTAAIQLSELYVTLTSQLQKSNPSIQTSSFQELYGALCACSDLAGFSALFREKMMELFLAVRSAEETKPNIITQIQRYIDTHYFEPLSLTTLSKQFYLSPSYLSALFSQSIGITFSDYLERIRMEQSAVLLRTTGRTISEIADAVGYKSSRYFCRLFKTYYACTPTEYRQRTREHSV